MVRPRRRLYRVGRGAFLDLQRAHSNFALSNLPLRGREVIPSVVESRGNVDLVGDKSVAGFAVLIVRELCGSGRRLGLRVIDALFRIVKRDLEHLLFDAGGMVSQKGANARMCGGGAVRVEDTGELGRWSRERSSPGWAAVRRRSGEEGETFAESVPAVAEGEVGRAAEAAMQQRYWGSWSSCNWLVEAREAREIRGVCANLGRDCKGNGYIRTRFLV